MIVIVSVFSLSSSYSLFCLGETARQVATLLEEWEPSLLLLGRSSGLFLRSPLGSSLGCSLFDSSLESLWGQTKSDIL